IRTNGSQVMAKRFVSVRVIGSDGRAVKDARVSIEIHQFMAGGFTPEQRTDSSGETSFDIDADSGAECTVYVNGHAQVKRGSIQGQYKVYI
ncbi:MAG TPA: hypothetical protein VG944_05025, partial [Fimbriimonas sp.]|nr:hypothetical protein [Fimbriimonas sp.]